MKRVLFIFVLCFTAFMQLNCAANDNRSQTNPQSGTSSPATPITAADLIEAYRTEGPDGAGKYKGQRLAVTGTVARKGKDFSNKLYVNLRSPANSVMEVHCTYNEEQEEAMSALNAGQEATITGVCDGRLSTFVILKDSVPQ